MIIIRPLPCGAGIAAHEEACDDAGNVLGITTVYAPSGTRLPSIPADVPFVPGATITHFVNTQNGITMVTYESPSGDARATTMRALIIDALQNAGWRLREPASDVGDAADAVWMTKGDRLRSLVITSAEVITYMDTAVTTP